MARDEKHKKAQHNWYLRNKEKLYLKTKKQRKDEPEKWKEYNKKYRAKYPEKRKQYEANYRIKNRKKINLRKRLRNKNNPLIRKKQDERYRQKYPEKIKAQEKLHGAIKCKKIKKESCVICGNKKSQGHHPDYLKPLEVIWLCQKHHYLKHLEMKNVAEK